MKKHFEKHIVTSLSSSAPLIRRGSETGMFYRVEAEFSVVEAKMPTALEQVS